MNQEHFDHLQTVIAEAQSIVIIMSPQKFDTVAAASSLGLGLQALGKRVTLLSNKALDGDYANLVGLDQIQSVLGNKNLQISFPYNPQAVNKVSYHIDEEKNQFYLIVQPEKNQLPLSADNVEFTYTGAEADLVFLVGVNSFEELEELYYGYEDFYQQTTVVALNTYQPAIGTFKFDTAETDSLSGLMYLLLKQTGASIGADIATNLLAGIEDVSDSFHSLSTSAYSFETAAELMKLGARRIRRRTKTSQQSEFVTAGEVIAGKETPLPVATASSASLAEAMSKKQSGPLPPASPTNAPKKSSKKAKSTASNKSTKPKSKKEPKKPGGLDYQPGIDGGVSGK